MKKNILMIFTLSFIILCTISVKAESKIYQYKNTDLSVKGLIENNKLNDDFFGPSNHIYTLYSNTNNVKNLYITNKAAISTDFFGNLDTVKCGNAEIPAPIPPITRTIVNLIKIATPLALIIMGMIDLLKAVISNDEKKIKDNQTAFIKRLIPAIIVFLVVSIIQLLIGLVDDNSSSITNCINCMISDSDSCIKVNKPVTTPDKNEDDSLINNNKQPSQSGNKQPSQNDNKQPSKDESVNDKDDYWQDNEPNTSKPNKFLIKNEYSKSTPIPYILYTPAKKKPYTPLIIWLHGQGEIGKFNSLSHSGLPNILDNWTLDDFNAYVLCPLLKSSSWAEQKSSVDELIKKIIKENDISRNKIILVGHSLGGYGVFDIANKNANFYSAFVVLSGYNPGNKYSLDQFKNIPTRGYYGYEDSSFMSNEFKNLFGYSKNVKVAHGTVPKVAFNLDENKDNKSDLIEWMLSQ